MRWSLDPWGGKTINDEYYTNLLQRLSDVITKKLNLKKPFSDKRLANSVEVEFAVDWNFQKINGSHLMYISNILTSVGKVYRPERRDNVGK